jgi:hypothetical protein
MVGTGVPPNRWRRRSLLAGHHVPVDEAWTVIQLDGAPSVAVEAVGGSSGPGLKAAYSSLSPSTLPVDRLIRRVRVQARHVTVS